MHPNPAEVVTKAWLHKSSGGQIKWLAWRAQHLVNNWWRGSWFDLIDGLSL
jgi:hypothetical protein